MSVLQQDWTVSVFFKEPEMHWNTKIEEKKLDDVGSSGAKVRGKFY